MVTITKQIQQREGKYHMTNVHAVEFQKKKETKEGGIFEEILGKLSQI